MSISRILIVDDEIIIARELEARLKSMGYEVPGLAASGAEALRCAGEQKPDLVLMDIVLKGEMDGIEAASIIRSELRIPVIYVTAYADDKTLARATITEPFAYIVKPFSERELKANIEMALYRHRTESRLRNIERWFADATKEESVAVIAADEEGRITSLNGDAEQITACPRAHAIGKPLQEVLRLVNRHNGVPISFEGLAEGPLVHLATDTMLLDQENRPTPVDSTVTLVRDEANRAIGWVSTLREVSGKQRRALTMLSNEVAVAVAESLTVQGMLKLCMESVVRNTGAAFARVWMLDPRKDVLILRASAGMYRRLDGTHSRIPVGESKIGVIAKEHKPQVTNDVQHDPFITDHDWARREGLTAFAGYPLMVDNHLVGVMALFSHNRLEKQTLDALATISRTIAVGIERKRLEDQLRHGQKMEVLGQLAGGVAHDFNNLLTVVCGNCSMLLESATISADDRHFLEEIDYAGSRAAGLTRQLLAFGKVQPLNEEIHDLGDLLSDIEKMLRRLIGEHINLVIDSRIRPAIVNIDRGQFEQVIVNLAINARDAMPDGGILTIGLKHAVLDASLWYSESEVPAGDYILVSVTDTGIGMTREVVRRIFEPYYTTKEKGKGTGLGLSTVYGIVEQSTGHIHVYSEPGTGTTFSIYLPRRTPLTGRRKSDAPDTALVHGNETILLVEDDSAVRGLGRHILTVCGYRVLEATNGLEALAVACAFDGPINLVVTDVIMPEMGGRELVERLSTLRPAIKALLVSGYTDDAVLRQGTLRAGAAFLQKPFTPKTIAAKIREVLDTPV